MKKILFLFGVLFILNSAVTMSKPSLWKTFRNFYDENQGDTSQIDPNALYNAFLADLKNGADVNEEIREKRYFLVTFMKEYIPAFKKSLLLFLKNKANVNLVSIYPDENISFLDAFISNIDNGYNEWEEITFTEHLKLFLKYKLDLTTFVSSNEKIFQFAGMNIPLSNYGKLTYFAKSYFGKDSQINEILDPFFKKQAVKIIIKSNFKNVSADDLSVVLTILEKNKL